MENTEKAFDVAEVNRKIVKFELENGVTYVSYKKEKGFGQNNCKYPPQCFHGYPFYGGRKLLSGRIQLNLIRHVPRATTDHFNMSRQKGLSYFGFNVPEPKTTTTTDELRQQQFLLLSV